jgi:hypothetical protein
MHKTQVTQILKDYTKLQERVLDVSRELYDSKIDKEQYEVYADKIVDVDSIVFYDNGCVEVNDTTYGYSNSESYISSYFPIEWLNMSDDEFLEQARIKKLEKDRSEAQKKEEKMKAEELDKRRAEYNQYLKLKEKFETKDIGGGFQNSGVDETDGMSGFRG